MEHSWEYDGLLLEPYMWRNFALCASQISLLVRCCRINAAYHYMQSMQRLYACENTKIHQDEQQKSSLPFFSTHAYLSDICMLPSKMIQNNTVAHIRSPLTHSIAITTLGHELRWRVVAKVFLSNPCGIFIPSCDFDFPVTPYLVR